MEPHLLKNVKFSFALCCCYKREKEEEQDAWNDGICHHHVCWSPVFLAEMMNEFLGLLCLCAQLLLYLLNHLHPQVFSLLLVLSPIPCPQVKFWEVLARVKLK